MPFAHSFTDVTPPARFDSVAWSHVRIEESELADGPFTQIDEIAVAVDATPDTPNPVDITTVLATISDGYFRFRFRDASSVLSGYSPPIQSPDSVGASPPMEPALVTDPDLVPTLEDVAALAHARTFVSGVARGTFDEDTYPTAEGVEQLCELAANDLHSFIGDPVPDALLTEARQVVAYRVAALLEASYFGDIGSDVTTPQTTYTAIYLEARQRLRDKVRADGRLWVA